jgi:hypothetical protein
VHRAPESVADDVSLVSWQPPLLDILSVLACVAPEQAEDSRTRHAPLVRPEDTSEAEHAGRTAFLLPGGTLSCRTCGYIAAPGVGRFSGCEGRSPFREGWRSQPRRARRGGARTAPLSPR